MSRDQQTIAASLHAVEAEHESVRQRADAIEGASDAALLAPLLEDLGVFLEGHFAREEGPGGFFEAVSEHAPRYCARLDALRCEHAELCRALGAVIALARSGAPWSALRSEAAQLTRRLRGHEHREDEILQAAFAIDLGGGD